MALEALYQIVHQALILALLLMAPPVLAVFLVGWIAGLLGAVTQTHDPVVTFVPKLVAAVVALLLVSPWIWQQLLNFTRILWTQLPL